MDPRVRRRVFSGLGANVYNQFVTVAVQLITVPVLLHAWGTQGYGEWLILFAVPGLLSMTNLGFAQSAGNDMTARVARGDRESALRVFHSLTALVLLVAAAGMMIVSALLWWLPLHKWLEFATMSISTISLVLWLFAAEVFVRLLDGVTHAGFRANGDYALHFSLNATTRLLQFIALWIVALTGGGAAEAAAGFLLVRSFVTPAVAWLLITRHRWLRLGIAQSKLHDIQRLVKPAAANMALPLASAINTQGMVLAVGAVMGPAAVVVFSTLRTLTRLALQMVLIVGNAAEPELARAHGAKHKELVSALYLHTIRGGLWLSLGAVAGLSLFGGMILDIWTQGQVPMDLHLFVWLLASAVATTFWHSSLTVLRAANRHLRAAGVYLLASVVAVILSLLLMELTRQLGYGGLSLFLMDVAVAVYVSLSVASLLGRRFSATLMAAINPLPFIKFVTSYWDRR